MILASDAAIEKWTKIGAWGEKTLIDYFKKHARADPDRVCVADPPNKEQLLGVPAERPTYQGFDRAVEATAEALAKAGIGKDDVVMVQ
ncbi:MAG: hypothetical protein ACOCS6_03200, partial [Desulfosalsimonas sp.]